ncbi:hypothetical protein [Microbulbifer variabilis]|uniref:hypothetical protein n=1 Tax=Microbulbifer variabilis TaxID=266805 RepID=UPI001CFEC181|nr:hypothetical protein [Microbulbifer variabilis]
MTLWYSTNRVSQGSVSIKRAFKKTTRYIHATKFLYTRDPPLDASQQQLPHHCAQVNPELAQDPNSQLVRQEIDDKKEEGKISGKKKPQRVRCGSLFRSGVTITQ